MQIFIVNIPLEYTDTELRSMFEAFGTVNAANIGIDKKTGVSEGYGIVEMPVKHEARAAVEGLRGKEVNGKILRVRILKPDDPFHNSSKAGMPRLGGGGQSTRVGMMRRGGQRGS